MLCVVRQRGPAGPLGTRKTAYTHALPSKGDMATERILAKLWATIESRRLDPSVEEGLPPKAAFNTAYLLANPARLRKKFNEEAFELNEAHQALLAGEEVEIGVEFGARDHVAREAADVLWHLYALLSSAGVTPQEVYAVIKGREKKDRDRLRLLAKHRARAESGEPAAQDETPPAETEREPEAAASTAAPKKRARAKPASAAKSRRGK